jgi:hypothetical protein
MAAAGAIIAQSAAAIVNLLRMGFSQQKGPSPRSCDNGDGPNMNGISC